MPAAQEDTAKAWEKWSQDQHLTGNSAIPDFADPEQFNRYTWYQTHDWTKPYPGDTTIYATADVPGAAIPGGDGDR